MVDVKQFNIEDLVPHAQPMILIDEPISAGENYLRAKVVIRADNLFYDASLQGIPSWVGMEMMAQTIAAYAGFQELRINRPVKVGFLLGTRKFQSSVSVLALDEAYEVEAKKLYQEDNGLGAFACAIHHHGVEIAKANLNVFSPENIDEFLEQYKSSGNE